MTFGTIHSFFYNGLHHILVGLPVSAETLKTHFTYYGNGVYQMSGFIHNEIEMIEVVNGIVTTVHNYY